MGIINVILGRRRKTKPCLVFERNASNNVSASHPDGKEFNSNNLAIIEQVRMAVFLAKGEIFLCTFLDLHVFQLNKTDVTRK